MAKPRLKETPQSTLRYNLIRQYRANFNSSHRVAELYGVSARTIRRWLRDVQNDINPVRNENRATRYLDKAKSAVPYLSNKAGELAELVAERKGRDFTFQSYSVKRGTKLPDNKVTRNAVAYQMIAKDRYGNKITSVVGTWNAATANMRKKMGNYPKFHATEVLVVVRARNKNL